jgi:flagellar basal-body rod protein FlgG
MDISVYQAAAGMNASSRWQDTIADNLAASQIPGFKKQDLSFSAVQSGYALRSANAPAGQTQRFQMPSAGASINFEQGELRGTQVSTDFAIQGSGFFQVQLANGSTGYTRDGEFHVDNKGQLITKQGLPVQGVAGPIKLDPHNTAQLTMGTGGELSQGAAPGGTLKLVEFNDPSVLTPTGGGVFILTNPTVQPKATSTSTLSQGFLENGNTSSIREMGNLITAMRFFEANQKVAQTEDQRVGNLITQVANET